MLLLLPLVLLLVVMEVGSTVVGETAGAAAVGRREETPSEMGGQSTHKVHHKLGRLIVSGFHEQTENDNLTIARSLSGIQEQFSRSRQLLSYLDLNRISTEESRLAKTLQSKRKSKATETPALSKHQFSIRGLSRSAMDGGGDIEPALSSQSTLTHLHQIKVPKRLLLLYLSSAVSLASSSRSPPSSAASPPFWETWKGCWPQNCCS